MMIVGDWGEEGLLWISGRQTATPIGGNPDDN